MSSGRMGIVLLADDTGQQEVVLFKETFEKFRHKLKEDELLVIEARARPRYRSNDSDGDSSADQGMRLEAINVLDLAEARARYARTLRLTCNGGSSGDKLRELLAPYRSGPCPVSIVYASRGAMCEIDLGEKWRVNPNDQLIASLSEWLKPENVSLVYHDQHAGH
jgi:DNA polymerase-3 subunit alpha